MKKIFFALMLLVLVSSASAQPADSPWPMFRGNLRHTGLSPYNTSHVDGTVKWTFETGAGIESSPAIASDGTIYITSFSNFLFAINPDGTEKWMFSIKVSSDTWTSPAIGHDGTIYIGSSRHNGGIGGKLYAINPDGKEKWHFQAESDIFPSPAIGDDGTIYFGSGAKIGR